MIPLGTIVIAYNLNNSEIMINKILIKYSIFSIFMGLLNILYYVGSFSISSQYLIPSKNQLGPIITVSIIILTYFSIFYNNIKIAFVKRIFYFMLMILGLVELLVIRNRAGILGIVFCLFIFCVKIFFSVILKSLLLLYSFFMFILALLSNFEYFSNIYKFIGESIFLNYDNSDLNSISANRLDGYFEAVEYLLKKSFIRHFFKKSKLI